MVAIFMLSGQSGGESGSLSERIARVLAQAFVSGFDTMSPLEKQKMLDALAWPIRKTAHASEYACLAISLVMTCWQFHAWRNGEGEGANSLSRRIVHANVIAFAIAVAYAASDEIHQLFIDGRAGQVADVLVDASGALVGCALSALVVYLFMRRRVTST